MFIAYDRGLRGIYIFFDMKKHSFYFSLLAIAAMAVAATSCTKEEIDSPGTDPGSDPTVQVPDPEGTITLSMRNDRGTYLDNFYIDDADNFSGGYFVSLGEMKGLGNVTRIPKHGWSSKTAVVPGTGYVAYNSYDGFYRLFVTSYTVNTMNEIIGADVKYQTPFYPTETIKLPLQVLEFGQASGSQNIVFDNENIVPFIVSSSADWCQVYTSSTLDYSFLTDGIIVTVTPNEGAQREATVSIMDGNYNIQEISIIQAGAEPYLSLSQDTLSLPYTAGTVRSLGIMTNYYYDDLSVTSSADWCQATLELYGGDMLARMNEQVRFKGKERVTDKSNYGTSSYTLTVYASSDNNGEAPREAIVTVASKDGTNKAELKVKQEMFISYIETETKSFEFDYASGQKITSILSNCLIEDLAIRSDAEWCTGEIESTGTTSQYNLYILVETNTSGQERETQLHISSITSDASLTLNIKQTPYSIELSQEEASFDRQSQNVTITVNKDDNIPIDITSDSDWATYSWNDNMLTIRAVANDTQEDRIALLSLSALGSTQTFTVYQSRYMVGDNYDVDGVTGTVGILTEQNHGKIYSYLSNSYAWSTEEVLTGANSETDGEYNMNVIQQIPGYETLYPAFKAVTDLNANGVTGWYLPASGELQELINNGISPNGCWSSTEYSSTQAIYHYSSGISGISSSYKTSKKRIIAMKKF